MKVPDEEVQREVREWLAYGDNDLRFAHTGIALPGVRRPPRTPHADTIFFMTSRRFAP